MSWVAVLSLVTLTGVLAWWFGGGADSAAMANPSDAPPARTASPIPPALAASPTPPVAAASPTAPAPAEPTITISRGRDAAPTTEPASQPTTRFSSTRPTSAPTDGPAALALGRTKLAADELVNAREVLNNALIAGNLSDTEALEAKKMIAEMSKTLVFSNRRLQGDPWIIAHQVEPGEVLAKLGSMNGLTSSFLQQINGITDARKLRAGYTIKIVKGPFHAVVTKRAFTMDIYLGAPGGPGSMYVTTYRVGLGTDDSTPTGKWLVEPGKKLPNPTYYPPPGQGPVIEAEDPKNPLGRYWIGLKGFEGQSVGRLSYGIHGTIEPNSIGKQASLGCIRLLNQDVAQVFTLLVEGKSTVVVLP